MNNAQLTDAAIVEISAGLRKFENVQKRMIEWHGKLIALGFDVDDALFMEVLHAMNQFSHDLSYVVTDSHTKNQIAKLLKSKAEKPAKPAPNMGWNCVPGVH